MTLTEVLPLAQDLSLAEKRALVEVMVAEINEETQASDPEVLAEMHRRVAYIQAHPDEGQDFDEFMAAARKRYAK